jgi:hypothetical protein
MTYADEAIKAVKATGRAWMMAARAMENAKRAADPSNQHAEGARACYALAAKQAADYCAKALYDANDLSKAAWQGRGRTISQYAADVACCVDGIAQDAAYWAKNPGAKE